jgi:hypothetical protein
MAQRFDNFASATNTAHRLTPYRGTNTVMRDSGPRTQYRMDGRIPVRLSVYERWQLTLDGRYILPGFKLSQMTAAHFPARTSPMFTSARYWRWRSSLSRVPIPLRFRLIRQIKPTARNATYKPTMPLERGLNRNTRNPITITAVRMTSSNFILHDWALDVQVNAVLPKSALSNAVLYTLKN